MFLDVLFKIGPTLLQITSSFRDLPMFLIVEFTLLINLYKKIFPLFESYTFLAIPSIAFVKIIDFTPDLFHETCKSMLGHM